MQHVAPMKEESDDDGDRPMTDLTEPSDGPAVSASSSSAGVAVVPAACDALTAVPTVTAEESAVSAAIPAAVAEENAVPIVFPAAAPEASAAPVVASVAVREAIAAAGSAAPGARSVIDVEPVASMPVVREPVTGIAEVGALSVSFSSLVIAYPGLRGVSRTLLDQVKEGMRWREVLEGVAAWARTHDERAIPVRENCSGRAISARSNDELERLRVEYAEVALLRAINLRACHEDDARR